MAARSNAPADPPPQIGRFTVLGVLGRGGMGVVYSAYDPELDRKVALKLVHLSASANHGDTELSRARLLHEAQATARLSHPNVVAVYEVGSVDDRVFLAMEYVKGDDLRTYAKAPRPWRDVLAAYRQAGAGLAAAHRAGVVHREHKPPPRNPAPNLGAPPISKDFAWLRGDRFTPFPPSLPRFYPGFWQNFGKKLGSLSAADAAT